MLNVSFYIAVVDRGGILIFIVLYYHLLVIPGTSYNTLKRNYTASIEFKTRYSRLRAVFREQTWSVRNHRRDKIKNT